MVGWMQKELSEHSGVSIPSIKRLEKGTGPMGVRLNTISALERALEAAGIEFIDENGGGPGVRMRKSLARGSDSL